MVRGGKRELQCLPELQDPARVMRSQPPEYSVAGAKKGSLWLKFKLGYCPSTKKFLLAPHAKVPWNLEEYGKLRGRRENPKAALR